MVDKVWSDWQHHNASNLLAFHGGSVQPFQNISAYNQYPNGEPPYLNVSHHPLGIICNAKIFTFCSTLPPSRLMGCSSNTQWPICLIRLEESYATFTSKLDFLLSASFLVIVMRKLMEYHNHFFCLLLNIISDENVSANVSQLCDFVRQHEKLEEVIVRSARPSPCGVAVSLARVSLVAHDILPFKLESKLSSITLLSHEAHEGSKIGFLEVLLNVLRSLTKVVDLFCMLPTISTSILMQQGLSIMGKICKKVTDSHPVSSHTSF